MGDHATFNADLARRVLTYISEHPEQHDQYSYVEPADYADADLFLGQEQEMPPDVIVVAESVKPTNGEYRCMTTACIAGWAVTLAGPEAVREAWDTWTSLSRDTDSLVDDQWFQTGRLLLGMTQEEAWAMFLEMDEEEALNRLREMVDAAERTT